MLIPGDWKPGEDFGTVLLSVPVSVTPGKDLYPVDDNRF